MRSPRIFLAFAIVVVFDGCSFSKNDNLNQAALVGDRTRCESLLSNGAAVNGKGMHDMRPIMSAARGGHLETAMYLMSEGADVNAHNDSGSALMWAIDSGNEELVRFLLANGANARWTNALGRTAVDFAREKRASNMLQLLVARTAQAESGRPEGCPSGLPHPRTCGSAYGGSWQSLTDAAATLSLPR